MIYSSQNDLSEDRMTIKNDWMIIFLIAFIHALSHFFQLLLPSLYVALGLEFNLDFAQLGLLVSIFYVVSGIGQVISGVAVDRFGPFKILFVGLCSFLLSSLMIAFSQGYVFLMLSAFVGGVGNSVFHPAGYSIINKMVSAKRLGYAYSIHGLSGSFGWALAPLFITTVTFLTNWRVSAFSVALLFSLTLFLTKVLRSKIIFFEKNQVEEIKESNNHVVVLEKKYFNSILILLTNSLVWSAFLFFAITSLATSSMQNYTIPLLGKLYNLNEIIASSKLSIYMIASAFGMFIGGWLLSAAKFKDDNILISLVFSGIILISISLGIVPKNFITIFMMLAGFCFGLAVPSRDMLVRRIANQHSTSIVYGVVYSGMDVGSACGPVIFGVMIDNGLYRLPWFIAGSMFVCSAFLARWVSNKQTNC
ncbi:arabinose efflux permease [Candidatus Kinetoplastibacterium desouzaii TCC079E]|uniref:Arabinose efflux permease n=1 Tax=Candidatus Kinetoplastidibacterium desouzai TCC079E TaxID=1208919 RepID=M1LTY7_9PROT|nr:MFS transporter [Candidatus Kinetoplastibacterium desouzaii]AGF46739.1 arabinose efflux permease [Candidatus Kinetoplastibacterium desouzaii TCC079E]